MSSSSSTSRNRLQLSGVQARKRVQICDCDVPTKERTCWKIANPGRRFWNCRNSLTRLNKCNYFEWKDDELEEGHYKNLLYSLKQKLDAKEDLSDLNNLRRRTAEMEFLLSNEKCKVAKSEKDVFDSRKAIGRYKMVVALLFLGLIFCVIKLGTD